MSELKNNKQTAAQLLSGLAEIGQRLKFELALKLHLRDQKVL